MSENELINMLLQRNDKALPLLELHYGPLIRYIIAPILSDQRDRDEVFSDIILRVWDRIDQFDASHGSWANWLSIISRNAAIDRLRKVAPATSEITEEVLAPDSDPEQLLIRKERQQALSKAIRGLTYEEQSIFYRKYYYRQPTAQIASECGTTERAIEGKLYRIKKKLRKLLGGGLFDE